MNISRVVMSSIFISLMFSVSHSMGANESLGCFRLDAKSFKNSPRAEQNTQTASLVTEYLIEHVLEVSCKGPYQVLLHPEKQIEDIFTFASSSKGLKRIYISSFLARGSSSRLRVELFSEYQKGKVLVRQRLLAIMLHEWAHFQASFFIPSMEEAFANSLAKHLLSKIGGSWDEFDPLPKENSYYAIFWRILQQLPIDQFKRFVQLAEESLLEYKPKDIYSILQKITTDKVILSEMHRLEAGYKENINASFVETENGVLFDALFAYRFRKDSPIQRGDRLIRLNERIITTLDDIDRVLEKADHSLPDEETQIKAIVERNNIIEKAKRYVISLPFARRFETVVRFLKDGKRIESFTFLGVRVFIEKSLNSQMPPYEIKKMVRFFTVLFDIVGSSTLPKEIYLLKRNMPFRKRKNKSLPLFTEKGVRENVIFPQNLYSNGAERIVYIYTPSSSFSFCNDPNNLLWVWRVIPSIVESIGRGAVPLSWFFPKVAMIFLAKESGCKWGKKAFMNAIEFEKSYTALQIGAGELEDSEKEKELAKLFFPLLQDRNTYLKFMIKLSSSVSPSQFRQVFQQRKVRLETTIVTLLELYGRRACKFIKSYDNLYQSNFLFFVVKKDEC